jgi:glycosyltransferase involved in cell wall biosynthesis
MRVLHVTQAVGGVETYILGVVQHFQSSDIEWAIAAPEGSLLAQARMIGIKTFPVKFVREPSPIKDLIALFHLIRIIKFWKPSILHVHSAKGGFIGRIAARVTRTPVVFTPNAFSYLGFHGLRRKLFLFLEQIARRWTDHVIAVSSSEGKRAVTEVGFHINSISVVENGVDVRECSKVREDYRLRGRVGMIGRLLYQKNPFMFFNVAEKVHQRYNEIEFDLLGAGFHDQLREQLETEIVHKRGSSYFHIDHWGDSKKVEDFYDNIDIFLLTSRFEGLPFSLLEAMVRGIPVVGTNVDGLKDVIRSGTDGFLVEVDDVETMTLHVLNLLKDVDVRKSYGHAARLRITNSFDITILAQRTCDVYKEIIVSP